MNKSFIRSTVECNGLRARVKREVFAAAVWDRYTSAEERGAALAYWHARQRAVDAMFYRLRQYDVRVPTRNAVGDAKHEARLGGGSWFGSADYRDEQRQLGMSAL